MLMLLRTIISSVFLEFSFNPYSLLAEFDFSNSDPCLSLCCLASISLIKTQSKKFGYADDWAIATRHKSFEAMEDTLTADLTTMTSYFRKWTLQPSSAKTEGSSFHLNHQMATKNLNV